MELPGLSIGPLSIKYYGIILMLGALLGAWLSSRVAKRRGFNPELVWDGLIWVLIGGIIGARLWHVLLPSSADLALDPATGLFVNPYFMGGTIRILDIITIWKGGLGIPGAIIGGGLMLFIFCRRKDLNFLTWADIASPGLALAQAIGRWGNYVNGELCGSPTALPWGITRCNNTSFPVGTTFHPIFLYESLWSLANMGFLLFLDTRYRERLKPGDIFLVYLIVYPIGRFLLEFIRLDTALINGINANQSFMGVVAIISAVILVVRHIRK